ncbi:DEAD/DEAH box helicase [Shinella zoogloeoides]|uniref:DEAD/DEAH box helicase n=1 Tax=Shinella zoogloeoides TaxID=352475 RepID=UPI00273DFD51|nr:DEAD/DEAH box helicase [Shinella zoogloeoides]WLR90979.1 DEAD/DEAH box helicase [Shinella zoogloeoides]
MAVLQLAHNATAAKLVNPPADVAQVTADLLSYVVDGADHIWSVNSGRWDGKSSFYDTTKHAFPAGFVYLVHAELTKRGHNVHLIRKPHAEPLGPEKPVVSKFEPYDFQWRALRQVEKHGRGIIQVATGGGKSVIAKLIMARYRRMTLFLTTRGILLYQMDDQLKEIGLNTGQIGDGEFKVVKGVNLGMVQTLVQALEEPDLNKEIRAIVKSIHLSKTKDENLSREEIVKIAKERFAEKTKKRNQIIKILEMIEVVIGEEAHEAGGESYYKILQHCKNATIRVALTATPFMRDSAEDNMRLMAAFGPKLIIITEKMLIDRGILAKPYFKFVDCTPHPKLRRTSPWERAYKLGYIDNDFMLQAALADALKAKEYGLPVMALCVRKEHGQKIEEFYKAAGLRAKFIYGESKMEIRRRYIDMLATEEIDVLIGTTILDVGVDVPAVGLVQRLGGYKAEVQLRQQIGRGLRAKKNMPNYAFIADYTCNINTTLNDHYRQRRAIVEATPGFAEGILPANQDFPWALFERKAA